MRLMERAITGLFAVMMAVLLLLVVGCYGSTDFACKQEFYLPQAAMLGIGLLALGGAALLAQRMGKRLRESARTVRLERAARVAYWPLLFCAQIVCCYFSYFLTGWDAGMMLEYAWNIGIHDIAEVNNYYYSTYPNNITITMIFAWIMRAFKALTGGEPGIDRCAFAIIAVQCALWCAAGAMSQSIARKWSGSRAFSWLTALAFTALIGVSPWVMIPYTDAMGLILPVAILWLYQKGGDHGLLSWLGIGVLTGVGYLLKPQTVIVTIALVLIELVRLMAQKRFMLLAKRLFCCVLVAFMIFGPVFDVLVAHSRFEPDPDMDIGLWHYLMMGLNNESNGGFSAGDEKITLSAQTVEERRQVQLAEIARRIENYGVSGLMTHLKKKALTNYADGTFAWAIEGQFFDRLIEDKDGVLSPWLKSLIYPNEDGEIPGMATYFQCIWLALLLGAACGVKRVKALGGDDERRRLLLVMMLSIIGLTAFEMLFEARARYLLTYAPVYVLLGVNGLWTVLAAVQKRA